MTWTKERHEAARKRCEADVKVCHTARDGEVYVEVDGLRAWVPDNPGYQPSCTDPDCGCVEERDEWEEDAESFASTDLPDALGRIEVLEALLCAVGSWSGGEHVCPWCDIYLCHTRGVHAPNCPAAVAMGWDRADS